MHKNTVDFIKTFCINELPLICIDEIEGEDADKCSLVLSTKSNMVSIELYANLTCDILSVDYESEEVIFSETLNAQSLDEVKTFIEDYLRRVPMQ